MQQDDENVRELQLTLCSSLSPGALPNVGLVVVKPKTSTAVSKYRRRRKARGVRWQKVLQHASFRCCVLCFAFVARLS